MATQYLMFNSPWDEKCVAQFDQSVIYKDLLKVYSQPDHLPSPASWKQQAAKLWPHIVFLASKWTNVVYNRDSECWSKPCSLWRHSTCSDPLGRIFTLASDTIFRSVNDTFVVRFLDTQPQGHIVHVQSGKQCEIGQRGEARVSFRYLMQWSHGQRVVPSTTERNEYVFKLWALADSHTLTNEGRLMIQTPLRCTLCHVIILMTDVLVQYVDRKCSKCDHVERVFSCCDKHPHNEDSPCSDAKACKQRAAVESKWRKRKLERAKALEQEVQDCERYFFLSLNQIIEDEKLRSVKRPRLSVIDLANQTIGDVIMSSSSSSSTSSSSSSSSGSVQ